MENIVDKDTRIELLKNELEKYKQENINIQILIKNIMKRIRKLY